ncbi:MAG: AbrB/MazE/SpoVT family DNA-binding domain-containing protein [Terracidiphilus sp.]|jgi:AbrB family looped-hinge helix DNA binding protein
METTVTSKGQVTIPKRLRDAMDIQPGCKVVWEINENGEPVLRKNEPSGARQPDRFDRALGAADIKLGISTDEYMELIRGYSDDPA